MLVADPSGRAGIEDRTPLARVGTAGETAALICFLLSDDAGYLTGQNIVLDGGTMLPSAQMDPVLGPLLEMFGSGDGSVTEK
jgi:NAD(P)-dependent dehydrogenase (short-subunit alcohol dehydrogenase family)